MSKAKSWNIYVGDKMVGTVKGDLKDATWNTLGVKPSLDEQFVAFHAANPEVYKTLVRLARAAREKGFERIGVRMLWEVMRWELLMTRPTDIWGSEFKLNDHYHSRYARMIMANEPDLEDLFELRKLKGE